MGALNCQKCINQETKIINELLLDGKEHRSRKVITSLEKQDTNSTPQKISTNFSEEKFNRINDLERESKKDKFKKIYLEIKNGNSDAIYDLDYNTLEVICNDSDSYQDFQDKESEKYIKSENSENNNNEEFHEFQKILFSNGTRDLNINDFINQKIKENQDALTNEEGINLNNNEIINNPDNYKVIYDKSMSNYKNEFNNFTDLELSDEENCNNFDNKIIEEKEEYENENEESSYKIKRELKYYSANLSQNKIKNIEINNIKGSTKSDIIKNNNINTEIKNMYCKKSLNVNSNKIYKQQGGKSITSYEIESDNPNIENINFNGDNVYNSIENSEK